MRRHVVTCSLASSFPLRPATKCFQNSSIRSCLLRYFERRKALRLSGQKALTSKRPFSWQQADEKHSQTETAGIVGPQENVLRVFARVCRTNATLFLLFVLRIIVIYIVAAKHQPQRLQGTECAPNTIKNHQFLDYDNELSAEVNRRPR